MNGLTATHLAPAAHAWLRTTSAARVLSVFDRACNLINQDEALLTLVASERGLTPFAMAVSSKETTPFDDVTQESPVIVSADHLDLGHLRIFFEAARLWDPAPDWPCVRRQFSEQPAALGRLAATTAELSSAGSLLDLYLTPTTSLLNGMAESQGGVRRDALLHRAGSGATDLVHGLATRSTERCLAGAHALAGLGTGLTPAGDDFIVGVLFAIWSGLYGGDVRPWCARIAESAARRTTRLSAAYLRAAARGECATYWRGFFEAVCQSDSSAVRSAIQTLRSVGHTSGADALAGFLALHFLGEKVI